MEKMMHLAAQYLAAAGISFVQKEADDSHTNLGFSTLDGSMYTWPLNVAGDVLALSYNTFGLEWRSHGSTTSFKLDGSTHGEILEWIQQRVADARLDKPFSYKFHYDLPYTIADGFTFKLLDTDRLKELMHLRILGQLALEAFLKQEQLVSEIRVWPHHFDTGAYAPLKDRPERAVGLGLAIPDTLVNDHYFYISGYNGHEGMDTSGFGKLEHGTWHNNGFKGAVLPATGTDQNTVVAFLSEAYSNYKN